MYQRTPSARPDVRAQGRGHRAPRRPPGRAWRAPRRVGSSRSPACSTNRCASWRRLASCSEANREDIRRAPVRQRFAAESSEAEATSPEGVAPVWRANVVYRTFRFVEVSRASRDQHVCSANWSGGGRTFQQVPDRPIPSTRAVALKDRASRRPGVVRAGEPPADHARESGSAALSSGGRARRARSGPSGR